MAPKRNKPTPAAGGAVGLGSVFPENIMLCIVTRLPVKSILRFKSVCKGWNYLFSTPKFMKTHHAQLSENPANQSLMIYNFSAKKEHTMSLFRIESNEKKPTNLVHPYPQMTCRAGLVGCCYGLLCIANVPNGYWIELWNPALKLSKHTAFSYFGYWESKMVSLGFGYDDEDDDFIIVRIVALKENEGEPNVEIYSANSDSWTPIHVSFHFSVFNTKNDAIVNGSPYWVAKVDGKLVLLCFDISEIEFKIVPMLDHKELKSALFVDWKGSLGALVAKKKNNEGDLLPLEVWVFDDVGEIWSKNHSFEPIELNRFWQCSKNGKFLVVECLGDGKVFVFDTENGGVKEIVIDEAQKGSFMICGYTESLAYIEGMKKVALPTEEEKKTIGYMNDSFRIFLTEDDNGI